MVCPAFDNLANCKIVLLLTFIHVKYANVAEIHCDLCAAVYGQKVLSEGSVRQWCSVKDGRTIIHDED
jgi:hypothetical protein